MSEEQILEQEPSSLSAYAKLFILVSSLSFICYYIVINYLPTETRHGRIYQLQIYRGRYS